MRVHIHLELAAAATSLFLNFLLPSQAVLMHAGLMNFLLSHASRALAIAVGWAIMRGGQRLVFSLKMREPNQHACSELVFLLSERDRSDYASPLEEKKSIGTFF